jgi:hypothetical protein
MRVDEAGEPCPETLGEYRELCAAISPHGEACAAVEYLDKKIAAQGAEEKVVASDVQMRALLFPLILRTTS